MPVADNGHQLLESFSYCVTTGPSGARAGGNICMEDQRAGNGPMHTHHLYSNDIKKHKYGYVSGYIRITVQYVS